jgi:hypothetical protein
VYALFKKEKLLPNLLQNIYENLSVQEFCENGLKKKNPPCGGGCFPKTYFQKPLFQTETLQEPQQGSSLIGEYHLKVIFGLTFPREEKE